MVQEFFFEILREKKHIFCDAKDTATGLELKKIVEGILNIPVEKQVLVRLSEEGKYSNYSTLEDNRTLTENGFSAQNAKAQSPAQIGLLMKGEDGPVIDELSLPPPIPEAMLSGDNQE